MRARIGGSFEDISWIIDRLDHSELVGVCLDTCHAFAAGYDIRMQQAVEDVVNHIDATVGIDQVKLIHLNDSIGDLNSHRNRHEHIGLGKIGEEEFTNVLHSRLGLLPLISRRLKMRGEAIWKTSERSRC